MAKLSREGSRLRSRPPVAARPGCSGGRRSGLMGLSAGPPLRSPRCRLLPPSGEKCPCGGSGADALLVICMAAPALKLLHLLIRQPQ